MNIIFIVKLNFILIHFLFFVMDFFTKIHKMCVIVQDKQSLELTQFLNNMRRPAHLTDSRKLQCAVMENSNTLTSFQRFSEL